MFAKLKRVFAFGGASHEVVAPWDWLIVVAFTGLGAFLRLWRLGSWGLWRDETWALFVAAKLVPSRMHEILMVDGHPPLFYEIMRLWALRWGTNELMIRLMPAVVGIATIPVLYWAGRALFSRQVGVLAAIIGALLPMHIQLSRSARMYSLLSLLATLSLWTLYLAITRKKTRYWVAWGVASELLLYTHNWALMLFVTENLFIAWQWFYRDRRWTFFRVWVLTSALVTIPYLPFVPILLTQFGAPGLGSGPWLKSQSSRTGNVLRILNELTSMTWPGSRPVPYLTLIAVSALSMCWRDRRLSVTYAFSPALDMIVLCGLLPVVAGVAIMRPEHGVLPSYVTIVVFPGLVLLLAKGLAKPPTWPSLMGVAAIALLFWLGPLRPVFAGPISGMREVAQYVQAQAAEVDVLVIAPDYLATPFNFYFQGSQPQVAFPLPPGRVDVINWQEWGHRWEDAADAVRPTLDYVAEHVTAGSRVWLIAPLDAYPQDEYFGQIRVLKGELDARYELVSRDNSVRGSAIEGADVLIYRVR